MRSDTNGFAAAGSDEPRRARKVRAGLLATTSLVSAFTGAALFSPPDMRTAEAAACVNVNGNSGPVTNSVAITCIFINNATIAGSVTNTLTGIINANGAGSPSGSGILIASSTINGTILNNGSITARFSGISIGDAIATGGITNTGTITAGNNFGGITLGINGSFSGPIDNIGTISAGFGIEVSVPTYSGGVTNGGTISATHDGIAVEGISSFAGGITNTGTVTAANFNAIQISDTTAFSGGVTNSGTLTGNEAGIFVFDVPTFQGVISNSSTGVITGQDGVSANNAPSISVFNSGTITGTHGTAILFSSGVNTLTLGPGFAINGNVLDAGADIFQLGGSGSGAFDLSTVGSSLQYQGFTTFNVVSGIWTVSNAFGQSQAWNVNGGTLTGAGALNSVNVNSGGTLEPGTPGSPGTFMTIGGNLAFQSGALYLVQINPTTASFANVTGTASLVGTAQAVFAGGSYIQKQYMILESAGLSGTFTALGTNNLPVGFLANLSYTATDVLLNLTANLADPTGAGFNRNQQNVATALNTYFNSGGTLPPAFTTIFGLSGPALTGALTQLSGESATGDQKVATQMMTEFLGMMLDPFVAGQDTGGGSGGAGTSNGFPPEQQASLPPSIALAYNSVMPVPQSAAFAQRWTAWGSGFGGSSTTNGNATVGSNNVTAATYGVAAGMDYHFTPDSVVGFALSGGGTNWSLAQNLGGGRSDAFQAGVYGKTSYGPAYIAAAFAFANHWFDTSRTAVADQLSASFQGQSYGGRFETGYRVALLPQTGVTPYAAVQAQAFHTPGYSETDLTGGGFGLTYNAMSATDTRSELGARFDTLQVVDNMPLVWHGRVSWAHDWVSNPALGAAF